MMAETETLTLEQVQRKVLEATKLCDHPDKVSGWVFARDCTFCGDTDGRVLLFPKAGEKCHACLGHVHAIVPCESCAGSHTIPTTDVGRLKRACADAGYTVASFVWVDGRVSLNLYLSRWEGTYPELNGEAMDWNELEALWRAMLAAKEAQNA